MQSLLTNSYVRGICRANGPTAGPVTCVSTKQWFLWQSQTWQHACSSASHGRGLIRASRHDSSATWSLVLGSGLWSLLALTGYLSSCSGTEARQWTPASTAAEDDDDWFDEDLQTEKSATTSTSRQAASMPAGFELPKPTNVRFSSPNHTADCFCV